MKRFRYFVLSLTVMASLHSNAMSSVEFEEFVESYFGNQVVVTEVASCEGSTKIDDYLKSGLEVAAKIKRDWEKGENPYSDITCFYVLSSRIALHGGHLPRE